MMDELSVKTGPGMQTFANHPVSPLGLPGIQWNNIFIWVGRCVHLRWSKSKGSSERIAGVSLGWVSLKAKKLKCAFKNVWRYPLHQFLCSVRIFSLNTETNFWPVVSHLVLFSLGRWSRHIKSWSLGLFYIFNVGVVGFISPPLCAEHILYCTWKNIHTLHSCTAARVGGAPCVWWDTEAAERDLLWGDLTGGSAEPSYHSRSVVSWQLSSWKGHTWSTGQTGMTMQGRAGKAPKREMVIESPQQYKCLAEIEAEVEPGSQVAAVSDAEVYLKTPAQHMLAWGVCEWI